MNGLGKDFPGPKNFDPMLYPALRVYFWGSDFDCLTHCGYILIDFSDSLWLYFEKQVWKAFLLEHSLWLYFVVIF